MRNRTQLENRELRHARCRKKIKGTSERPRISLFISNKQVYTQLIDDVQGKTLASASTVEPALKELAKDKSKAEACKMVGTRLAEVAKQAGITKVVFDRSGYKYGKRLRTLADAAREGGLEF